MNPKPRVRIPPSPTGYAHIGTARTALLNHLFARKHGGQIILRIEDTDKERSKKEYEDDIKESITWLGLNWDEFYRQSDRAEIYTAKLKMLIDSGKAYISEEESKKTPGTMMKVVRLKNPGTKITFTDIVRGDITFDTEELKDFVIARSETDALYHFAVVVDDGEMGITHIIRGEDHISNTPRQILIQEALGYPRPEYAHFPLNLAADRSKLSKRKGDVSVRAYRSAGYLPQALLNYLGIIGWTPGSGKELLTLEEMTAEFELEGIHKSGSIFDMEKLRWFNRQYLLKLSDEDFARDALAHLRRAVEKRELAWDEKLGRALLPLLREKTSVWEDIGIHVTEGEYDYFFKDPTLDTAKIAEKKSTPKDALRHLEHIHATLKNASVEFSSAEKLKELIWDYAGTEGRGAVLWPMRYALTGADRSPDPFAVSAIVGQDATLRRIETAIKALKSV